MPRVFELIALLKDRDHPSAYFQCFEESLRSEPAKLETWRAREREFERLDNCAWTFLKTEALPFLTARDAIRGWEQLIAILNQARAHNYLVNEGHQNVRFIPRAKNKGVETPDLEAESGATKVLCEVKTVQISEVEATRRSCGGVGSVDVQMTEKFFAKLSSALSKAKSQMCSYGSASVGRRIAFIIFNFDDLLGEYKGSYYRQVDRFLATDPVSDIDVVIFNQRTVFNTPVKLVHASVINE